MFSRIKQWLQALGAKKITDQNAALLRHVQGATVAHVSPFANIEVPILPPDAVNHLYPQFVAPFYMKRLRSFDKMTDEAFIKIREEITDDLITKLLSDFNWRSRTAAAYFATILDRPRHIDHLGRLLLRSDVCYAGAAYCVAMAQFRTTVAIEYVNRYLAYYLTRPDLHFDQGIALSALRFIDRAEGTSHEAQHTEAIDRLNSANSTLLTHVSSELIAEELNAAARIRKL